MLGSYEGPGNVNYFAFGAVVALIITPIVMLGLRHLFPVSRTAGVKRSFEDLQKDYRKWELFTFVLMFTIAPSTGYGYWKVLCNLVGSSDLTVSNGTYSVRAGPAIWAIPAMVLGILTASLAIEIIYKGLLKERYREYVAYQNMRYRVDSEAMAKLFYLCGGVLVAIFVYLVADWYALFTPAQIRINPFWGFRETTHTYTDIVSIKTAPKFKAPSGALNNRRAYVVHFSDSSTWDSTQQPSDPPEAIMRKLIVDISDRSNVPITELPLLSRKDFQ